MNALDYLAGVIRQLSTWIDEDPANASRDREAAAWGRLSKVAEEHGEAVQAYIAVTGQNPRKGVHGSIGDVKSELLDVALTALAAYEHFDGNRGEAMRAFGLHVRNVAHRAGVA